MERNIKNIIKNAIYEALSDKKAEVLTEQIMKHIILEADDTKKKNMDVKRNAVLKQLRNNRLKNSQFAYALWHPKDQSEKDTYRSLFSKKVNEEPDADGNIREFTDEEISKLYELLKGI